MIFTAKSQENGTSESSSPTLQQQSQTKHKDNQNQNHTETKTSRSKENHTNGPSKKSKDKSKQKNSHSTSENEPETQESKSEQNAQNSVFDNDSQSYLSNELDELESDRHSLLENHDLLDNSDHSLLDDDTHNLLNDANNEVMMMQRHKEMLAGLVDNHLIPQMKPINGYGLLDRDMYLNSDRPMNHTVQGQILDQKDVMRSRNLLMRHNEMLRQHSIMVEPKHYMPTPSIGLESASELLGEYCEVMFIL